MKIPWCVRNRLLGSEMRWTLGSTLYLSAVSEGTCDWYNPAGVNRSGWPIKGAWGLLLVRPVLGFGAELFVSDLPSVLPNSITLLLFFSMTLHSFLFWYVFLSVCLSMLLIGLVGDYVDKLKAAQATLSSPDKLFTVPGNSLGGN